jgi:C4-dicarboxylate-specific signal transduction histidine kinase
MTALDKAIAQLGLDWRVRPGSTARSAVTLAACLSLVLAVAFADHATGYDIRLAILYLAPIAIATWQIGGRAGGFVAATAAVSWLVTFASSHPYSHPFYFYWEGGITAATYLIVVVLLTWLRRALARSDQRFVTVLEGLDAAVYVEDARSDAAPRILFANRRFRDAYGGRPPISVSGGDSIEVYEPALQRWFLVQSRPLQWVDGRAVTLRMLSDITEGKRVRELMIRHRDAVHRSARLIALGEFASAVAHELSQPLAAIATYNNAALLLVETATPRGTELREAMEKCRSQARRAGTIIQRLKELLRHPTPALMEHDLNEIALSAAELAESEALEAGVKLELAPGGEPLAIGADRVLLQQVVMNLVRNAIEACRDAEPGARRVAISTARGEDGGALLRVTDWGCGVGPDIRPRLFQAFVTARPGGLGLGLSICRSVVEAHGGEIRYRPNDERGSVFEFSLPARHA